VKPEKWPTLIYIRLTIIQWNFGFFNIIKTNADPLTICCTTTQNIPACIFLVLSFSIHSYPCQVCSLLSESCLIVVWIMVLLMWEKKCYVSKSLVWPVFRFCWQLFQVILEVIWYLIIKQPYRFCKRIFMLSINVSGHVYFVHTYPHLYHT
jgi:hypothetical protein